LPNSSAQGRAAHAPQRWGRPCHCNFIPRVLTRIGHSSATSSLTLAVGVPVPWPARRDADQHGRRSDVRVLQRCGERETVAQHDAPAGQAAPTRARLGSARRLPRRCVGLAAEQPSRIAAGILPRQRDGGDRCRAVAARKGGRDEVLGHALGRFATLDRGASPRSKTARPRNGFQQGIYSRHSDTRLIKRASVRPPECNLARDVARSGHIARICQASAKRLRQHGHAPSYPLMSAENAIGCGIVMIAFNDNGSRGA
jgi:hypothetical protein